MSVIPDPGPVAAYVVAAILLVVLVAYGIWAWRIKKAIGEPPPDRPGHENERFRFKYGADAPGSQPPTGPRI